MIQYHYSYGFFFFFSCGSELNISAASGLIDRKSAVNTTGTGKNPNVFFCIP